jgi:Ca2+-transporting ATPase
MAEEINSSPTGISQKEAQSRLKQYGFNEITDLSHNTPLKIILRLIRKNYILYLLLFGAAISFFVGEEITAYAIVMVLGIITAISFIQEFRAEQAIEALRGMIVPVSIVIRDGKEIEIPSRELVPGDLLVLRLGEKIPADCVLIEESELKVNEAVLTGESEEVKKEATSDINKYTDKNLIFMGTFVVNGKCKAVVLHTGMNTKFGNIAHLITATEKTMPLQDKINSIAKYMVIAAISISLLTGLLMALRVEVWSVEALSAVLILIIALSVSAFPEGLPVVLITTLAVGATRMAKQNAIVNRMSIIETLGETTVICTDKTGTITAGEMTATKVWIDGKTIDISGVGDEASGSFQEDKKEIDITKNHKLHHLLQAAVLCNDSRIELSDDGKVYSITGTPTEGALLIMGAKAHIFKEDLAGKRLEEMPFNSSRKMMSVLQHINGENIVYVKGALEVVLKHCSKLSDKELKEIEETNKNLTQNAYRTIALAYKSHVGSATNYSEDNLTFLGLVGISDPPREEIKESIALCKNAGISVKMITGDNKDTALAIASQIGLSGDVLTGDQLDTLSEDELSKVINHVVVFARVKPEHKLKIVKVLKDMGEIVTMTGDGVNDAPALKEAHIGVAMGQTGTDVTRSVADLTLKDDNFATIVVAIKEGRTIFINIRKFVSYQLSCNWTELAILLSGVILAPFLGWEVPILLALQILFMNLITDDLPALTLGFNHSSQDVMSEKPLRNAKILNKDAISYMSLACIAMAVLTLSAFYISFNVFGNNAAESRTVAMLTLIILEIVNAFNFRSFRYHTLTRSPLTNPYLFWASIISLIVTAGVIYTPLNVLFETVPLGLYEWLGAVVCGLILAAIFDLSKLAFKWK